MSDDELTSEYRISLKGIRDEANEAMLVALDLIQQDILDEEVEVHLGARDLSGGEGQSMAKFAGYIQMAKSYIKKADTEFDTESIKDINQNIKNALNAIDKADDCIDLANDFVNDFMETENSTNAKEYLERAKGGIEGLKEDWEGILKGAEEGAELSDEDDDDE